MKKVIVTYKGRQYYKIEDHEKVGTGALHCQTCFFNDGKVDEHNIHSIKHAKSVGKKPPDFKDRYFFNRVPPIPIKKQKFKIENIFIEK